MVQTAGADSPDEARRSPRNEREENMGVMNDPDRLSCQSEVKGDVTVEVIEY